MRILTHISLLVLGAAAGCMHAGSKQVPGDALGPGVVTEAERQEEATTSHANELVMHGIEVYRQQYCGTCHRFGGAETAGIFGPPHDDFAIIAAQRIQSDAYSGNATSAADYVRESIVDPDAYITPGYPSGWQRMPPYVDLAPEDLDALVHVLLSTD